MSTPTRCDCCDLPVESCGKATEKRQADEAKALRSRLLRLRRVMPALYPGTCVSCDERFSKGDPVTFATGGSGMVGPCCLIDRLPEDQR